MRMAIKHPCVPMSLTALVLGMAACGSAKEAPVTSTTAAQGAQRTVAPSQALPSGQTIRSDGDADNPRDLDGNPDIDTTDPDEDTYTRESYDYPDDDDKVTLFYGHRAPVGERKSIADLITRYYAAAATADGATACSLFSPVFRHAVPEDYGAGAGPPYLRGYKTCAGVLSQVFVHNRLLLGAKVHVLSVRMKGDMAQVVYGSSALPAGRLFLQRHGHSWYMESLLGSPLP